MALLEPLPESEAVDKVEKFYGRLKELLETDALPEVFLYLGRVPALVNDFYMNFKKFVYTDGKLDRKSKAMIALTVSAMLDSTPWANYFKQHCEQLEISAQEIADLLAVAATNNMYNIFFKFRHLSGSDLIRGLPVGLRAHTFNGTGLDDKTVELLCLVLSNMNACKPCVIGHFDKSHEKGTTDEEILEAIQCASVVACGASYLNALHSDEESPC